jgi:hypothetical protein
MSPEDWIHERAPGLNRLKDKEIDAITNFSLYGLFLKLNSLNLSYVHPRM